MSKVLYEKLLWCFNNNMKINDSYELAIMESLLPGDFKSVNGVKKYSYVSPSFGIKILIREKPRTLLTCNNPESWEVKIVQQISKKPIESVILNDKSSNKLYKWVNEISMRKRKSKNEKLSIPDVPHDNCGEEIDNRKEWGHEDIIA